MSGTKARKISRLRDSQNAKAKQELWPQPSTDGKTGAGGPEDRFTLECLARAKMRLGTVSAAHDLSGLSIAELERVECLCDLGIELGLMPEDEIELTELLANGSKQASNQAQHRPGRGELGRVM